MPTKLFMIPHTVPNSRRTVPWAAMVARMPVARPMSRAAAPAIRSSFQPLRSLIPSAPVREEAVTSARAARTSAPPSRRW